MRKKTLLAPALLMTLAVSAGAIAATGVEKDIEFVKKASISSAYEIEASRIALQRTQDTEVRAFAQKMIADHTRASEELKSAAADAEIDLSNVLNNLDDKHRGKIDELVKEDSSDFNEQYLDDQKSAHNEAVNLFEEYIEEGTNPALKAYAEKTLPTLKGHEEHAKDLESKKD